MDIGLVFTLLEISITKLFLGMPTQDNNAISVIYVVAYEIVIDIVIVNHYKGYDCK